MAIGAVDLAFLRRRIRRSLGEVRRHSWGSTEPSAQLWQSHRPALAAGPRPHVEEVACTEGSSDSGAASLRERLDAAEYLQPWPLGTTYICKANTALDSKHHTFPAHHNFTLP
jgi:hypothetical protein